MIKTADVIRDKGLKVTPQRISIYNMLTHTKEHPSAEDIYKTLIPTNPAISLATVYKTLDIFKSVGLVQELSVGNGRNNYDAEVFPHPHVVCSCCNKIYDFDINIEHLLLSLRNEISKDTNFDIHSEQLIFYGICNNCK